MKQPTSVILLSAIVFASSCNRYYYKPNAVNTPLFTKGGQAHLAVCGSAGDGDGEGNTSFFDLQAAVSPINHLGIIANYSTWHYTPHTVNNSTGDVVALAHLAEAGIGGYYAVGERKAKLVVDVYGGGGLGNLNSDVNMKATRFFIQPGIGMSSPWVDASFNFRLTDLIYSDFDAKGQSIYYLREHRLMDDNNKTIEGNNYFFIEPSVTVRGGYKFAKVQLQLATALAEDFGDYPQWSYSGVRFTAGFYFSLEGLKDLGKEMKK